MNKLIDVYPELGIGYHTREDVEAIWALQEVRCYFCECRLETDPEFGTYHKDHLRPKSLGGPDWPHNIALTCPMCNQKKLTKGEGQYWNVLARTKGKDWVRARRVNLRTQRCAKRALSEVRFDERWDAILAFHDWLTDLVCDKMKINPDTQPIPLIKMKEEIVYLGYGVWRNELRVRFRRRYSAWYYPSGRTRSMRIWFNRYGGRLADSVVDMVNSYGQ